MKTHRYTVYILLCADDTYYVGMSNDLERRLREHMEVRNPSAYTATRLPVILKWHQDFNYVNTAIAWEKRIKRWSVRKKEALIAGDFDELIKASKKNFS